MTLKGTQEGNTVQKVVYRTAGPAIVIIIIRSYKEKITQLYKRISNGRNPKQSL